MKQFLLIIFSTLITTYANCSNIDLMYLTRDFLLKFNQPKQITVFANCWKYGEYVKLGKILENHVQFIGKDGNVTYDTPEEFQFYLLDLNCDSNIIILEKANKLNLFSSQHTWLIIINYHRSRNNNNYIVNNDNLNILLNSNIYVVIKYVNYYLIKSIYKIRRGENSYYVNDIGKWYNNINGFVYYNPLIHTRNRTNLYGTNLNVSYVFTDLNSLNHLNDYRDIHIDPISKFNYLLTRDIMRTMNATTRFILQRTWGYKNETTGLYSGMVGDLQQGFSDIGGTALFFSRDRVPVIDYIAAPTKTFAKFIFRAPPLSYVTNVFTQPFDTYVWYSSFLLTIIVSIVMYIIIKMEWSNRVIREHNLERRDALRPKFCDVVLMQVGAICQQGAESEPTSSGGRIATIFIFIAFMFIYTSYSANIVALLQSTTDSIRTVEDLTNSFIKLGVDDKPYSRYYFQIEKEPKRKLLYEKKIAPKGQSNNFMSLNEGIKRMREEYFAFHIESAIGYKVISETFTESEKCGLMEIDVWRIIEPYNVVQKNSSYKELVKIGFRKIHEYGIQSREFRLLYTKKPACQQAGSNFMSVGLIDCYYAFLIFAIGGSFSITILIMEILFRKYKITNGKQLKTQRFNLK